jgi:DNA-binding response OmpR family regulator
MQVLIADDDPVYRGLMEDLLKQWNFDVLVASDGAEAWELIQQNPSIKIAILDWMMPNMDGYEVCRNIKEGRHRDIHTVLVTGSRFKSEIIRVLVVGADDFVMKPFEAMDLKIRLRTAVTIVTMRSEIAELQSMLGKQLVAGPEGAPADARKMQPQTPLST